LYTNFLGAYIDINLDAIAQNWRYFNKIAPEAVVSGVIKADAYGLGVDKVAHRLQNIGCNNYFVATLKEAIEARQAISASSQLFVLGGFFDSEIDIFSEFDLIPVINSVEQLEFVKGSNLKLALHIDTGMNRLGLRPEQAVDMAKEINNLNLALVMSHLVSSSERDATLNKKQLEVFTQASSYFNVPKSLSASGGTLLGKEYHFDIVRPGIGLYGGAPIDNEETPLEPVVTLYAPILQVRGVKAGESVGYSAAYVAKQDMKIATIGLGYADGFLRSAGNKGIAYVDGKICPILGKVSMDMIAIDISDCDTDIKCGNFVELLGKNVKLDEQAKNMGTISYEILTRLGNRFKRNYLGEH
jgi:alanine racemase